MSFFRIATLAAMAIASAASAEVVRRDVQVSLGFEDPGFDYAIASPIGTFSGSDAYGRSAVLRAGGRMSWGGPGWAVAPVVGIDALLVDADYEGEGLGGYGMELAAGAAWAVADGWLVEAEAAYGLLSCDFALPPATSGGGLEASGELTRQRVVIRGMRAMARSWWIGAEAGYASSDGELAADRSRTITLESSGWTAGLVVAWRWANRPEPLE